MRALVSLAAVLALTAGAAEAAQRRPAKPAPDALPPATSADWREPDAENTLVIDTTKGRIVVEMRPDIAPGHVERIKLLTRRGFYDGIVFHRVIDWFMAQTGDPLGTGEGQSPYPDLKGELTFMRGANLEFTPVAAPAGAQIGFVGSVPVMSQTDALMSVMTSGEVRAWGLYCPGVAGMARGLPEDSANSQFFLMRQPYPSLDKRYTVWGRVLVGLEVVRAIKTGEPVEDPDRMTAVRVLADMPADQRPSVRYLDPRSESFRQRVARIRAQKGADFSACDIDIPTLVR